jgi:hypothetical protein
MLTVTDPSDHHSASLILEGDYSSTTFSVTADQAGGVDVAASSSGEAKIATGGTLELSHATSETITFEGPTGSLVLDTPSAFKGEIAGFRGTAPDAEHSDTIDLVGIDHDSAAFAEKFDGSSGTLAVTDGQHSATLNLSNLNGSLQFASDHHGGTLITEAAQPNATVPEVATSDQFVFRVSTVSATHETLNDFQLGQSKIGLDFVAFDRNDADSFNSWLSSHAVSSGKDLLIDLDPHGQHPNQDTILLKNVASANLHANDFILPIG